MCANDSPPQTYQPLLNRLFDSEAGSDVIFLVGHEQDTWRFPGHRSVLCEANPVFKAMLENFQEKGSEQTIAIQDVDGRAFDLLLRYLYKEDVVIQSVPTALSLLYAAQKYLCMDLMRECIVFLDDAITPLNALQIYEHLRVYSGQRVKTPSAPPYEVTVADTRPEEDFSVMLKLIESLLYNTLLYIDQHAEEILSQESIEDLTMESLKEILERDTLVVQEPLVYNTIERWSNRECKRCQLELSQENRRSVLGDDLLFSVRYLRMSQEEFISGPMSGNLLSKAEAMTLFAYIRSNDTVPVTNTCSSLTENVMKKMRTRRRQPKDVKIPLGKKKKKNGGRKSSEKKSKKKKDKSSSSPSCSGSCFLDYLMRGLSCLFD